MDRAKGEVAFEIFESLFNGDELQIVVPELCGILLDKIGAQQISAFAPAHLSELLVVKSVSERGFRFCHLDHQKPPRCRGLGTRGTELHEQLFTRELHARDFLEPRPQPLEPAPAYRALLADAIFTLRQNIELAVLRQQLHLYARSRLVPWLLQQLLLVACETALWRTDDVLHRRIGRAHIFENLFGRNAPIHHPHTARLAILALDARQKIP